MPNALYTRLQGTADKMIGKFGTAGSVITMSTPDPVEGGEPTPTPHPARVVVMKYDARYVDGTVILANDVQIYISAIGLSIEPKVGMLVQVGSVQYLIIHIDPNRFDGATPVVYVCQGRTAS